MEIRIGHLDVLVRPGEMLPRYSLIHGRTRLGIIKRVETRNGTSNRARTLQTLYFAPSILGFG